MGSHAHLGPPSFTFYQIFPWNERCNIKSGIGFIEIWFKELQCRTTWNMPACTCHSQKTLNYEDLPFTPSTHDHAWFIACSKVNDRRCRWQYSDGRGDIRTFAFCTRRRNGSWSVWLNSSCSPSNYKNQKYFPSIWLMTPWTHLFKRIKVCIVYKIHVGSLITVKFFNVIWNEPLVSPLVSGVAERDIESLQTLCCQKN